MGARGDGAVGPEVPVGRLQIRLVREDLAPRPVSLAGRSKKVLRVLLELYRSARLHGAFLAWVAGVRRTLVLNSASELSWAAEATSRGLQARPERLATPDHSCISPRLYSDSRISIYRGHDNKWTPFRMELVYPCPLLLLLVKYQ